MIIADTGFFVALFNPADKHHRAAVAALSTVTDSLVTTWPVLTETMHLASARLGTAVAIKFFRNMDDLRCSVWNIPSDSRSRISDLMTKYRDLPMDLADASLVLLAEHLGDGRILSTDTRDFNAYRWKERNPFKNLIHL